MIRTAIISSLLRNQSCVMGIGLRCFGENIADADTATIISIIMPSAGIWNWLPTPDLNPLAPLSAPADWK